MSLLTVGSAGLYSLAEQCQGWSREVSCRTAPGVPAASALATTAAVAALHARAELTGQVLSGRMSATDGYLSAAAGVFTAEDADDAAALAGLAAER